MKHQRKVLEERIVIMLLNRGSRDVKLSAGQVKEISDQLIALKSFMPNSYIRTKAQRIGRNRQVEGHRI